MYTLARTVTLIFLTVSTGVLRTAAGRFVLLGEEIVAKERSVLTIA